MAGTVKGSGKRHQYVWAPQPLEGYVLGTVIDVGDNNLTIQLVGEGQTITAYYDNVFPAVDEAFDKQVEDNCSLVYLNEATLLHNVHQRYQKDLIYSYVANILLAVNPYKDIPGLYSMDSAMKYKGKSLGVLPPHVFAIADKVYRDLRTNKQSQSIIVSGESGAGKTESTKYVLRYLTKIYGAATGVIEQCIVEANPLLEAFGNSKTVRNINSSRFGKFVEVHFDTEFKVVGGHVSHYLLEKSRVCSQMEQERNYHIFYYLLAGAPQDMKQSLGIDTPSQYKYLNPITSKQSMNDKEGYKELIQSMDNIGMSSQEKNDLFRVTASVLHLGNITFEEETIGQKGGSTVSERTMVTVKLVSKLLGIGEDDLCRCLTSRIMTTTKKGQIGTVINVPLKPDQASNARDALAKAVYLRLFNWIVARVNNCFPFDTSRYYIGVLDIAGFEYYQFNSFEQFCINYCNEKLQQLFNERVLKEEQELYKREGLGLPTVRYIDNQDCIDLLEHSGSGIIDLLDEECRLPRGSNEGFTERVHKKCSDHFRLQLPRQSRLSQHRSLRDEEGFIVRHFAGGVCYKTIGFIEKNNDALHSSLEQLLMTSTDPFIHSLFPDNKSSPSLAKKLALESVSSKFRTQLNQLMQKLRETGTSFIRCLKPNQDMISNKFLGGQVLSQLQCAGMVAVLKLMEGGYPSRTQFVDLYNMYKSVLPSDLVRLDPRMFCEALFQAVGIKDREFKFGQNKVFFRAGKFAEFDEVMQTDPQKLSQMVSKVKQWLIAKQWRKVIYGAISVQKLSRKIEYRQKNALIVQSVARTVMAMRRYQPRYKGVASLEQLKERVKELTTIATKLKTEQEKIKQKCSVLITEIDKEIIKLKAIHVTILSDTIDSNYNKLVNEVNKLMTEIQHLQEQEKVQEEERELMRILKDKQTLEQRARELRIAQLKAKKEEDEKQKEEMKKKIELETQYYLQQKKEQEQRDLLMAQQLQQSMDIPSLVNMEQERRDFELALRLSQNEVQSQTLITEQIKKVSQRAATYQPSVVPTPMIIQPVLSTQPAASRPQLSIREMQVSIKSYDLSKWKYAQLRDTINTSCDIKLLEECKEELHRRLKAYHSWRNASTSQTGQQKERIPQHTLPTGLSNIVSSSNSASASTVQHRFFKVPFLRPASEDQTDKTRGWWYAHFDGHWIARQLELHPNQAPLLLYAGYDDMEMCELRLEETGLSRKKGAEITKEVFEEMWTKCGGKPYHPPSTQL